jgi:hypothetical protein
LRYLEATLSSLTFALYDTYPSRRTIRLRLGGRIEGDLVLSCRGSLIAAGTSFKDLDVIILGGTVRNEPRARLLAVDLRRSVRTY